MVPGAAAQARGLEVDEQRARSGILVAVVRSLSGAARRQCRIEQPQRVAVRDLAVADAAGAVKPIRLVAPIDDERAAEAVDDDASAEDAGDAVDVDRRLVASRVRLVGQLSLGGALAGRTIERNRDVRSTAAAVRETADGSSRRSLRDKDHKEPVRPLPAVTIGPPQPPALDPGSRMRRAWRAAPCFPPARRTTDSPSRTDIR